ncbi:CaiB/BaiF CoA transferase family protein [Streptomyces fuscichromogenes]|uniref:CaiB/BaiF CoA transferase family protein n=1 Tax=Streptomyces fuscichromogenes TaxID=1324013 RepID=UPI00382F3589
MTVLAGLRVLELAGLGPGPFAAMLLADLGADVVVVDRPGGVHTPAGGPTDNLTNRGKRSVALDLKTPEGVATALDLAARADVLIEGFRPGVCERLGLGPERCWERNPALVYGRMTGWGQDGPLAATAGHDLSYLALSGVLHAIGNADAKPQVPLNLVGDFGGGSLYLVVGLLAALRHAERTGRGQVVDAAIVDGAAHLGTLFHGMLASGLWEDRRGVNLLDSGAPFYDTYETADGRYMAVAALEPQFYAEFVRLLGLPESDAGQQMDQGSWPGLRNRIATAFRSRTRDEWAKVFEMSDACVSPVLSLREAPDHPHLAARGAFTAPGGVRQPVPAPRFSETPPPAGWPPPVPGTHTAEVLIDWGVRDDAAKEDLR